MADSALHSLTAKTTPVSTDEVYLVQSPFGSGDDRRATIANLTAAQDAISGTVSNKTLDNSNTLNIKDANFTLQDDGGSTRLANFQLSGITAGNTRTITVPDSNTTLPICSQVVTISGPSAARTYTFPDAAATIARTDSGQTFTGVQVMTSPKIVTGVDDTNGNHVLAITATGSAVNYVKFTNAATGTAGPIISAEGETNTDLKIAGKGTGKAHFTTGTYGDVTGYSPAGGGTATLTCQTSNIHQITMPAGNITIALSNDAVGQSLLIDIIQDSGGSRTVTWFSGIKWAGGSAPTLTTTGNKIDTIGIRVVTAGSAYYGYVVGANI